MASPDIVSFMKHPRYFTLSHEEEECERLNWLPVTYVFKQCDIPIAFKYFKQCPNYLNEVLEVATESNFQLRNSFQRLKCPFRKTITVKMLCLILVQPFGTKPLTHSSEVTILIPPNIILKKYFKRT